MEFKNKFMNIAHRGASGYYPENTISSFQAALNMGIKWMECDVRLTSDKEIVVIHDRKVDRTTDASGLVSNFTLKELKQMDAGSWFDCKFKNEKIPTLKELFDLLKEYKEVQLVVEIKDSIYFPEITGKIIYLIKKADLINQITISSFHWSVLKETKNTEPAIKTAALVFCSKNPEKKFRMVDGDKVKVYSYLDKLIDKAKKNNINIICPPANYLNEKNIHKLHQSNFPVRAWGLNNNLDIKQMKRLIKIGIDGMTTNYPDVLRETYNNIKNKKT
ncbi:MAG: glycerophosphodiester phosphodiesterase [Bacillota bacterium]